MLRPLALLALVAIPACKHDADTTASTSAPRPGPQPSFPQALASLSTSPPAISGGTLAIAPDGHTVIAADPDRDLIYVVDTRSHAVTFTIPVAAGAEPGRVAVDDAGHAYVALRSAGAVVRVELATGASTTTPVCVAPRGLAWDPKQKLLHVACAEGFLVSTDLVREVRKIALDRDVRDVLVDGDRVLVSRFRTADVVTLDRDGQITGKTLSRGGNVAWRTILPQSTTALREPAIVSQEPTNPHGDSDVGYYGSGADDPCQAPTITSTRLDIPGQSALFVPPAVLPVDLATNGRQYAIVAAGNAHTPSLPQIYVHDASVSYPAATSPFGANEACQAMTKGFVPGEAIAAAFDGDDQLLVQSREPAALYVMSADRTGVAATIPLASTSREDAGHAIFHANSGGFIACASCHAEGTEDGRTWRFLEGDRRTPSLRGTLAGTAPFHWDGAMKDVHALVDHVFVRRMSGPTLAAADVQNLQTWLFRLPAPARLARPADRVARGQAIFGTHGCADCHSGASFTNNTTKDVGTGGAFQVPPLTGLAWRAPYLHNGCAKTLKDRFVPSCGGDHHGAVEPAEIDDLTAYLETL